MEGSMMILRRVELGQFGKWSNRIFEFRRGANLVLGGNEAGKTTLATAIPAVLFGLRDKERFIPWEGAGGCEAALVWEDNQRFWRLERDLCTDEVALTVWHEGGEVLRSFSGHAEAGEPRGEYAQLLRELLGQEGSENVISGSFCPFIEEPVFPLPQGAYFRQRSERPDPLAVGLAPGEEILRVRRQLAELEERWYALRPATGQLQEIEEQLAQVREALAVADPPAPTSETEVPAVVARTEAPPAAGELTSRRARRQQLQEELARLGLPVAMSADLPLLLAEAEALRRELVSLQKEAVRIRETRATRPAPPWKVAVIASALSLLLGVIGGLWLAWGAVGWLGGALLAALVWLVNGHYHGRHLAEDARYKGQAQAIEERREAAQEQLGAMDDRFRQMNISPSAVSLLKMQKNIERSRVIVDELHRLEGALAVLEGISSEETEVRNAPDPVAEASVTPMAEPPSPEARALMERHRLLERERERLQGLIAERQQIEKEGEGLRDQEAILARALKDPALAMGQDAAEHRPFADECARLLALLGGRRPYQVAVTPHQSLLMKEGPEGTWRSPFAYGHGAGDLLDLAARLATDSAGRQLLLFDGGLAHLERARLAEVFGALERIARQRQVIVFCREEQLPKRLARERWQVVSLEEESIPTERDDHAGQLHLL
jgi:hypothetical protein